MKRTRIRPRSARQAREQALLADLCRQVERRAYGYCQVRLSPSCAGRGSVPHHVLKRSAARQYGHRLEIIVWCCVACNGHVEDHPDEARAVGASVESWEVPRFLEWCLTVGENTDEDAWANIDVAFSDARMRRRSFDAVVTELMAMGEQVVAGETAGVTPSGDLWSHG